MYTSVYNFGVKAALMSTVGLLPISLLQCPR
jgi:hypothetical protein